MKTRKEWFNNLPKDVAAKAIANSTEEQLNTEKPSLYTSLCDDDGFSPWGTEEGYNYWDKVATDVWAAENPTEATKLIKHHKHTV